MVNMALRFFRRSTLIVLAFVSGEVASAATTEFEIHREIGKPAHASLRIKSRSPVYRSPGPSAVVNGVSLKAHTNRNSNLSLEGDVPAKSNYELIFQNKKEKPERREIRVTVNERKFDVQLPASFSTGRDLVIPFTGEGLTSRDKLLVKLTSGQRLFDRGHRNSIVLTAVLDGKKIVIPASSMRQFKAGRARLRIAIVTDQSVPGSSIKAICSSSVEKPILLSLP